MPSMKRLILIVPLLAMACAESPIGPSPTPRPATVVDACYSVLSPPVNPVGYKLVCPGDAEYVPR